MIIVDANQQPPVFRCTICGGTDPLSLPVTVSQLKALGEAFRIKHAMCPVREELKKAPKWEEVKSFPVTDPNLDAPDGAEVDGFRREGDEWVKA